MTTRAAQIRHLPVGPGPSWPRFREFIRWEVAPYPGRVNTVVRMTVTATLVMIIVVTFRIPNPFLAAFFSILLARENLAATWRGGRMVVIAFAAATLYTLLGMMLFRGYPITHFFWVIGSLYLIFFVMRATTNYAAAAAFAIPIGVTLPIWDRTLPSELQVEGTLWPVLIIAIGAAVTVGTEALYRVFDGSDPLITSIDSLLLAVQQVAEGVAAHRAPPKPILETIHQYNAIGTGRLRLTLQRQGVDPARRAQRSALISLTGRLIGLAASVERNTHEPSDDDAIRMGTLSLRLGVIRKQLRESGGISTSPPAVEGQPSSSFPMLQEMERTVALITEVFQRDELVEGSSKASAREWWQAVFLPDAFQNPEYVRFALAGCLSASACYVVYNALDWPGISTAVLTCIVTALSTIGNSVQAQFLRLAGFVAGGLVLGISAQILILPGIDSIFGFALFFAAVTAIAAWFATSSPRLSFFGVQMALAFYFVNLQDFRIQTDLTIARDKVVGVLLGILAMGFIFDRFGTKSDAEQLQKLLVRNVRMLAQLATCPVTRGRAIGDSQARLLASQVNDNFASMESQMDAVRFEFRFRDGRAEDAARFGRIEWAQSELRSIYLMELSLRSHRRRQEFGSEITQQQNQALDHFLDEFSDELMCAAAWIEIQEESPAHFGDNPIRLSLQSFDNQSSPRSQAIADICEKMVSSLVNLQIKC